MKRNLDILKELIQQKQAKIFLPLEATQSQRSPSEELMSCLGRLQRYQIQQIKKTNRVQRQNVLNNVPVLMICFAQVQLKIWVFIFGFYFSVTLSQVI